MTVFVSDVEWEGGGYFDMGPTTSGAGRFLLSASQVSNSLDQKMEVISKLSRALQMFVDVGWTDGMEGDDVDEVEITVTIADLRAAVVALKEGERHGTP